MFENEWHNGIYRVDIFPVSVTLGRLYKEGKYEHEHKYVGCEHDIGIKCENKEVENKVAA